MRYKLPRKYMQIVFAFYMSAVMALLMCMVIVAINTGVGGHYFIRIIQAYTLAMPTAFVFLQLVRPLVVRLVNATVAG